MIRFEKNQWAVVLGGSSGMGLAAAKKLARHGMSVCAVHRDRQGNMPRIEGEFAEIRAGGAGFVSYNVDAVSPAGRQEALDGLTKALGSEGKVRLLLHSIAFGNLKPLDQLDDEDMARTIYCMGTSLLTWVQDLHKRGLFAADARVLGLTSEGNEVAWRGYAAVSAAKLALEAVSRSIAAEFAPYGIRSNVLQPGVTDTPALRLIPGHENMLEASRRRNPLGRLTRTEDVANMVCLMCTDEAAWVNGALIRVDGGEKIAGPGETGAQK
jgi:NAD(P)-dependent dehydrogenase (short-subunit alcohol dehydrogenase family)